MVPAFSVARMSRCATLVAAGATIIAMSAQPAGEPASTTEEQPSRR